MTPAYFVEVTADEANLRPHPSTDAPPVTAVARGTQLAVVGAPSAGWLPVIADAHAGWIAGGLVTKLPRLVVDASDHSELGHADARAWLGLVADRRYVGVILKATEAWGSTARWSVDGVAWFKARWPQLVTAAGARYGDSFFRGAYHFLIFDPARAVDQADFYLRTVDAAGGWGDGDLIPIVDVERGSERGPNYHAAAATVIETVQAFVARVRAVTGQRVLMYGRGAMRDLGIRARMGADYLWNPGYTATMPSAEPEGWPLAQVMLWQYTDGRTNLTRFPTTAPIVRGVDLSVSIPDDLPTLRAAIVRASTK